jgi:hypothetical protein
MMKKYNVAKSTKSIDQYWQWEREQVKQPQGKLS